MKIEIVGITMRDHDLRIAKRFDRLLGHGDRDAFIGVAVNKQNGAFVGRDLFRTDRLRLADVVSRKHLIPDYCLVRHMFRVER